MKILLITGQFPPVLGGASVVYHQLAHHLGAEVCVLAPTRVDASRQSDASQSFEIRRVPFFETKKRTGRGPLQVRFDILKRMLLARVSIAMGLMRYLWHDKPDVVCLGQRHLYWAGTLINMFTKAPIIYYIHGEELALANTEEFVQVNGRIIGFLHRRSIRALRKADAVVSVGRYGAANLVRFGVREQRIRVIYNGVDHSRFTPGERDPVIMARHDLWGKCVLLTIARLDARKGQDTVIRAMATILMAVPNAVYVIAGDGPQREHLEALVAGLRLQSQVIFSGQIPDHEVCAYYRSCDLFVHPNRNMPDGDTEGFGLVFLEAGACGKPVIGGNAGGVPEAVVHGTTGLLVNGESATEVAEAAVRILCDQRMANTFAVNGREWAARFSWEATARNFRKLCSELARPSIAVPVDPFHPA